MTRTRIYMAAFLAASLLAGCRTEEPVDFALSGDSIEIDATGGVRNIKVSSPGSWTASTGETWITVSPANGVGSAECQIKIDSALVNETRTGVIRISDDGWDSREITVTQKGFDYAITLVKPELTVKNYAEYGTRYFDVKVNTNVDFDVVIPDDAKTWLSYEKDEPVFDYGLRPRNVNVRFNWEVNTRENERYAEVSFSPKGGETLVRNDKLKISQNGSEPIHVGFRDGDSTALLAVARNIGVWEPWNETEPMTKWDGVELYESGENKGRVRSATFNMVSTKEGIPFEVQYLTAAKELVFFSNDNKSSLSLDPGEYITELTQLERLTISYYGLTSLPESFSKLSNLKYLNLEGNNFDKIPEVITKENFPNLTGLEMNTNYRNLVYDLSNATDYKSLAGFYEDGEFPRRLLEWEKLDTLTFGNNYFTGQLPDMSDYETYPDAQVDSLGANLSGLPKVLPNIKYLMINNNRFTGEIPDWLKYHPRLDWLDPFTLIFNQEGKTEGGDMAGFSNLPANLDYYYEKYPNKKLAPKK